MRQIFGDSAAFSFSMTDFWNMKLIVGNGTAVPPQISVSFDIELNPVLQLRISQLLGKCWIDIQAT
jgi:hypothetical protein